MPLDKVEPLCEAIAGPDLVLVDGVVGGAVVADARGVQLAAREGDLRDDIQKVEFQPKDCVTFCVFFINLHKMFPQYDAWSSFIG